MPRNGSSLYYIPPGTEGFPDTTIESAKYNTYIHDVETDLNLPRPVVTGGTGATTADGALINLGAEKAGQEVDNFDSYAFMAGSFYSTISTTAPPVAGHLFSGIAHITNASNMVLEAVDLSDAPHTQWIRVKTAGAWGPWTPRAIVTASDTPPTGSQANDNALWWESDTGILYVRYNDGNSTQWVVASPVPDVSSYLTQAEFAGSAVRYDAPQALSGPEQQQALQNIYAAPADAMAYSGMQINGGMEVSQERGFAGLFTGPNGYICDGWQIYQVGTTVNSQVDNIAFPSPAGMSCFLNCWVGTPKASLAAGDICQIYSSIEGYRVLRLAWGTASAQPITINFWTAHFRAGTYSLSVSNSGQSRVYTTSYTQNVSSVWEYKTITVPGDVTGTWLKTNGAGIAVNFVMAAGTSAITSAANTWGATNTPAAPGQVNGVGAGTDIFRLTGVTVLPGIEAPSAGRSAFIMRPYDQELVTCQRYFQKSWPQSQNVGFASGVSQCVMAYGNTLGVSNMTFTLPVTMRTAPTMTFYDGNGTAGAVDYYTAGWNPGGAPGAGGSIRITDGSFNMQMVVTNLSSLSYNYKADARL